MPFHRTQILLEPAQHAELKSRAEAEGVSLSEIVRRLVDESLARRQQDKLTRFAGLFEGGPLDPEEVDRIVYRKDW